jgi:hypothetical protein
MTDTRIRAQDSGVVLDGLGSLIENDGQYEQASALCLLSIACSLERIANSLDEVGRCVVNVYDHGPALSVLQVGR